MQPWFVHNTGMIAHPSTQLLSQLPAFQPIPSHLRADIARNLHVVSVSKHKPYRLFYPPATHYLLPLSENLTLHKSGDVLFGLRLPHGVLWPVMLKPNEEMQVRSTVGGQLAVLSAESVTKLLRLSAETRFALLQCICQSQTHITNELEQYACNDLSGRVARLLLDLEQTSATNTIRYAHSQLAALLNAQRESVSVIIGRFRRAGWLETSYGCVKISDHTALLRMAEHY